MLSLPGGEDEASGTHIEREEDTALHIIPIHCSHDLQFQGQYIYGFKVTVFTVYGFKVSVSVSWSGLYGFKVSVYGFKVSACTFKVSVFKVSAYKVSIYVRFQGQCLLCIWCQGPSFTVSVYSFKASV